MNKIVTTKTGRQMYYVDGKLTSKENYDKIMSGTETSRVCLFDSNEGVRSKFVNFQTVRLCEDHYQHKTTGEIAMELNGRH